MKLLIYFFALTLIVSCNSADQGNMETLKSEDLIRINQVGYYSGGPKIFMVV